MSIRKPYCDQIVKGQKRAEYRSRRTLLRERVYLYASLTPADSEDWEEYGRTPGDLPTGVVVGSVESVGCLWNEEDEIFEWKLARPKRLRRYLVPTNQPQPAVWRPGF